MEVAKWRGFLKLTQQEMADTLEISKTAYWNKENGRTPFSDKEKILIKNMLIEDFPNIKIDDIFFSNKVLKSNERNG